MKLPGATGEVTGDALSSRLYSPAAAKCVRPLVPMGPDSEAAVWPRVSLVQSFPLAALVLLKPERAASVSDGRQSSNRLPCNLFPPVLVMMLIALPVPPPYSAVKTFSRIVISCTDVSGKLLNCVCRPQLSLFVAPSTSNQGCRRPAPFVVKRFWFMKTSPWLIAGRLAAFKRGRYEIRRLGSGVSSICAALRRSPNCGPSVRTSPTAPVTVTCACPAATLSSRWTSAVVPPASVRPLSEASAKPGFVAEMLYSPDMGNPPIEKSPFPSVTAVRLIWVSVLVAATLTPGAEACAGSVTCPWIVARSGVCPQRDSANTRRSSSLGMCMKNPQTTVRR